MISWEFERNRERYQLLKWGQQAFDSFKVVPPDTGIVRRLRLCVHLEARQRRHGSSGTAANHVVRLFIDPPKGP